MVIAVCSLALAVDRERGEVRGGVRLGRARAHARRRPARRGRRLCPDSVAAAASPIDDVRGTAEYRRHALRRAHPRALERVLGVRIELTVNGEPRECDVWGGESLLFALRERLGLPGSKNACEQGECGSCSVLLDGVLVCACLVLAAQADGHEVATVEGLAERRPAPPRAGGVRRRGRRPVRLLHAGLVVAAAALLDQTPSPRTTRSARRSPATSAAARATRRSSTRCGPRPHREYRHADEAARARQGRRRPSAGPTPCRR